MEISSAETKKELSIPVMGRGFGTDASSNYYNQYWLDYTGRRIEQETGDGWADNVFEEDIQKYLSVFTEAFNSRKSYKAEFRLRGKNGEYRWMLENGQPTFFNNKFTGYVSYCVDINDQKLTEIELRKNQKNLKDFLENANIGLHWVNQEGIIIWANQAELDLLGYSREEYIGQPISKFHADPGKINDILTRLTCNETLNNYEAPLLCKDGTIKYVLISSSVLWEDGKFIHTRCFTRDITDKKLAEERARQSEKSMKQSQERLKLALSAGALATYIWNIPQDRMYPDENMCKLFGQVYPLENGMPLQTFVDAIHPDDVPPTIAKVQEAISTGCNYKAEYRVKGLDGHWRWVIAAGKVEYIDGNPDIFSGFLLDITDRKKAEEALAESEAKFRRVSDSNMLPLAFWNLEGYIVEANDAFLQLLSYTREDLLSGKIRWKEYCFEEDMSIHNAGIAKAVSGQVIPPYETRLKRTDGKMVYALVSYAMMKKSSENGIIFLLDITEKKQAELEIQVSKQKLEKINLELKRNNDQLKKVNNDLDNFIYTASHDLKSPVSNIEGLINTLSDMVNRENPSKEDLNQILEMMDYSINRFSKTINDLTTITKIQKDTDEEPAEKVNIPELIEDIKLLNGDLIANSGTRIIIDCENCMEISFSRKNLKSILYNLITNAIKYRSPERNPEVHISTEKIGSSVILKVKDNGLGLDQDKQKKLFTMFKRFHDHVEGTGIGLYLVKRIITNAGGKIEIESQPGVGSTFKVYFEEPK